MGIIGIITIIALGGGFSSSSSAITGNNIECSSSNDDESFCEHTVDGDHQTFWRSNDITFEGSGHHYHQETLFLEFDKKYCVVGIRFDVNFCHYIFDKVDDVHFRDKLAECRNYHGEEDTSNLLCGYTRGYMYATTASSSEKKGEFVSENGIAPVYENYVLLNREIRGVKLDFKCYLENGVKSDDFGYQVNAIVREISFHIDSENDETSPQYKCAITPEPLPPPVAVGDGGGGDTADSATISLYVFCAAFILTVTIGVLLVVPSRWIFFFLCNSNTRNGGKKKKKNITVYDDGSSLEVVSV